VLKTKTNYKKRDGSTFFLQENSVALINKQGSPLGTRIIKPVPRVLKKKKFMKFISMSNGIL